MTKRTAGSTSYSGMELAPKKEATATALPPSMSRSSSSSMSTTTLPTLVMEGDAQDWCGISQFRQCGGWQKLAAAHHCRTPRYGIEDMQDAGNAPHPTLVWIDARPGPSPAVQEHQHYH